MTEHCPKPERDCPIDSTFLQEHGAILARLDSHEEKLDNIYNAVTNGHGLTQRMNTVEGFIEQVRGSGKTWKGIGIVIGVLLVVLQIVIIIKEKI
jgi:hypothetical protein